MLITLNKIFDIVMLSKSIHKNILVIENVSVLFYGFFDIC